MRSLFTALVYAALTVFGGIYILRKTARSVILESEDDPNEQQQQRRRVKGIICTGGMRFATKWLIAEASYAPECWIEYGTGS